MACCIFLSEEKVCFLLPACHAEKKRKKTVSRRKNNFIDNITTTTTTTTTMARGKKQYHPFSEILNNQRKKKAERYSYEHKLDLCTTYLEEKSSCQYCVNMVTGFVRDLPCNCLHVLQGNEEATKAVARYMCMFIEKKKLDR